MTGPDLLAHLAADCAATAEVLRSTDPGTPVVECPDWALRDLARHLGGVHRWATTVVRTGDRADQRPYDVPDAALVDWFAEGAAALQAELAGDPDRPVWTFPGPGTAHFWRRRQAHETAVHRVDAQRCAGTEQPVPQDLARDGVGEVVEVMHPRQVALGRTPAPTTTVRLVGASGGDWRLGDGPTVATVTGPDAELLLLLWRRRTLDAAPVDVQGDRDAVQALLATRLTP